jgi:enoyl-CoA hydratase/carnithine racemase
VAEKKKVRVDVEGHVATLCLNQPETGNRIDRAMCHEFRDAWDLVRDNDEIRVAVVRADGDAFCNGVDWADLDKAEHVRDFLDPGAWLGPKRNRVWKPVICAVNGVARGGAFHWINESDIIIAGSDAQFLDDDLSNGKMSALVPIGLAERMPIGEVMRMVLMSLDEAMSAKRACELGLVSELVAPDALAARATQLAKRIAAKSPTAAQGSVRAIWESQQMPPWVAQSVGGHYVNLGNDRSMLEVDPSLFESGYRPQWELR